MFNKSNILKKDIINIGKKLYNLRLVSANAGNLSAKVDENNIFITATGSSLGNLNDEEILKVNLMIDRQNKRLSTEFPLHKLIYQNFAYKTIIHCHPPLVNGYFAVYNELKNLTFESKLYLGNIPIIEQETPSITKPELVTQALKISNIVVIRNHGVVSVADKFNEALYLIEMLEEAVKTASVARLFKKEALDDLDQELKKSFEQDNAYLMFSPEHIQAIVDLVNQDEFIAKKGEELDLTLKLAIKMEGLDKAYKFNFEKGKITKLSAEGGSASGGDVDAPFIISAPPDAWELVFLGKLDPFVATMQGKMKLKGELGKLSRWYVPFSRLFELFKSVKIK